MSDEPTREAPQRREVDLCACGHSSVVHVLGMTKCLAPAVSCECSGFTPQSQAAPVGVPQAPEVATVMAAELKNWRETPCDTKWAPGATVYSLEIVERALGRALAAHAALVKRLEGELVSAKETSIRASREQWIAAGERDAARAEVAHLRGALERIGNERCQLAPTGYWCTAPGEGDGWCAHQEARAALAAPGGPAGEATRPGEG